MAQASKNTAGKMGEGQLHLSQALGKILVLGVKSTEGTHLPRHQARLLSHLSTETRVREGCWEAGAQAEGI